MCYILCMTSYSVCYVPLGMQGGLRGAIGPPVWGFGGSSPEKFFLPRETCSIFASFFVSPRFSCPLLGDFSAHGFCRWFSIFWLRN
jgi:hypothetical protein